MVRDEGAQSADVPPAPSNADGGHAAVASPADRDLETLLADTYAGKPGATDALAAAIYDDLRAMAARRLHRDFGRDLAGVTIQPTVLASDTLMRLLRQRQRYDGAGHLFAIASRLMTRVLIDYHRERTAAKRGDGAVRLSLSPERAGAAPAPAADGSAADVEAIEAALQRLAALDARKADVVRYRILWDMTVDQTAAALGVAGATVERDWAFARAWLARELSGRG